MKVKGRHLQTKKKKNNLRKFTNSRPTLLRNVKSYSRERKMTSDL